MASTLKLKVKLLDQSVHDVDVEPTVRCIMAFAAAATGTLHVPVHSTDPSLQTLVSDFKCLLEATLNIPVNRQRLIYRGRPLRDEQTMQDLGARSISLR